MKIFKFLLLFYVLTLGACKKDSQGSLASFEDAKNKKSTEFIKNDLLRNKKIFSIFESSDQVKNKLLENYKWKNEFLKDGVANNDLIAEAIQPNLNKDKEIIDEIFAEFPYLSQVSQSQWKEVLSALYLEFLNEKEGSQNKIFLVDKCRDYLMSDRKACDINYGIAYSVCMIGSWFTGPFVAPVAVLCVSGATAVMVVCYNTADDQYEICKRPDVE